MSEEKIKKKRKKTKKKSTNNLKIPIYKKWWFIFICGIVVGVIISPFGKADDSKEDKNNYKNESTTFNKEKEDLKEYTKATSRSLENEQKKEQTEKSIEKEKNKQENEQKRAEKEKRREIDSDITKLSDKATVEQIGVLSELARNQFNTQYPYKGSKMHALGVLQDWTEKDGEWFYKTEATIANGFDAKRSANVEVHIKPTSATSGEVTIIDY